MNDNPAEGQDSAQTTITNDHCNAKHPVITQEIVAQRQKAWENSTRQTADSIKNAYRKQRANKKHDRKQTMNICNHSVRKRQTQHSKRFIYKIEKQDQPITSHSQKTLHQSKTHVITRIAQIKKGLKHTHNYITKRATRKKTTHSKNIV